MFAIAALDYLSEIGRFYIHVKKYLFPSHWTSFYVINRQLKSKDP